MWAIASVNDQNQVLAYYGQEAGHRDFYPEAQKAILYESVVDARISQGRRQASFPELEIVKFQVDFSIALPPIVSAVVPVVPVVVAASSQEPASSVTPSVLDSAPVRMGNGTSTETSASQGTSSVKLTEVPLSTGIKENSSATSAPPSTGTKEAAPTTSTKTADHTR